MAPASGFYYRTFALAALLPYIGGTVIHVLRLVKGQLDIPFEADYVIVLLGGYAGIGFVVFWRRVPLRSIGARILHGLVAFHLLGSVVLHAWAIVAGNHDLFAVFSYGYSYFAVGYFIVLGSYCFVLQRSIRRELSGPSAAQR